MLTITILSALVNFKLFNPNLYAFTIKILIKILYKVSEVQQMNFILKTQIQKRNICAVGPGGNITQLLRFHTGKQCQTKVADPPTVCGCLRIYA